MIYLYKILTQYSYFFMISMNISSVNNWSLNFIQVTYCSCLLNKKIKIILYNKKY